MSQEPRSHRTPTALLDVSQLTRGTATIVHARGEIDMGSAPLLAEALTALESAAERPARIVLDLSEVTFMSSAGLTILNTHHHRSAELDIRFLVVASQRAVVRTLALTGISEVVTVVPDVDKALALP
jgi:anti-sigma B factor antagonist